MPEERSRGRRTFGRVVLLGLAGGALAAVAGYQPWAAGSGVAAQRLASLPAATDPGEMPAAGALALVVLACWGVILVTRGRVRRAVAVLGVLASVGLVAAVVTGWSSVVDSLRSAYAGIAVSDVSVHHTGWFWAAAVGAVVSVVATALAVRWAPEWPEMGSRYDAPAGERSEPEAVDPAEQSSLDLWRAMDEGRDPTAGPAE